jgi:geranylgeranyl diphosphate synthase type II
MYVSPITPDPLAGGDAVIARMRALAEVAAPPDSPVLLAVRHHLAAPGHGVRGKMALEATRLMGLDTQTGVAIAAVCDLLHNASLIHDDLSDGDTERRGIPTVWSLFGRDIALCAGDLLLSCAYLALSDLPPSLPVGRLLVRVHQHVAETIHGQAADLQASRSASAVAAYEAMAAAKSGPLLALPLDLVFTITGELTARDASRDAVRCCAVAYQIADDLADLAADELFAQTAAANIVVVHERAARLDRETAIARATAMARDRLDAARGLARTLPNGTGAIVAALAALIEPKLDRI